MVWRCALPTPIGCEASPHRHKRVSTGADKMGVDKNRHAEAMANEENLILPPLLCAASHAPTESAAAPTPPLSIVPRATSAYPTSVHSVDAVLAASTVVLCRPGGSLSLEAVRGIALGEELTLDFGARNNAELLVARGEILAQNELDSVRFYMEPSSIKDDGYLSTRVALLGSHLGLDLGDELLLHPKGVFDPITIEALAILAATPSQLQELAHQGPFEPLAPMLELRALENLRHVCSVRLGRFEASLEDDEHRLEIEIKLLRKDAVERGSGREDIRIAAVTRSDGISHQDQREVANGSASASQVHGPAITGGSVHGSKGHGRRMAVVNALKLRILEQQILEDNLEASEGRVKELRKRVLNKPKQKPKARRKDEGRWDRATGFQGTRQLGSTSLEDVTSSAMATEESAVLGLSPRLGGEPRFDPYSVPPMRWSQNDTHVVLTISLPRLSILDTPSLDGRILRLHVSGHERVAPVKAASTPSMQPLLRDETAHSIGKGAGGRVHLKEFNASLVLWEQPQSLRASDISHRGSQLKVLLTKPDPLLVTSRASNEPWGSDEGSGWPRLLESAVQDGLLRRHGVLLPDLETITAILDQEEADNAESERVRHNLAWLEDKWARENKEHTNLAELIENAPRLDPASLRDATEVDRMRPSPDHETTEHRRMGDSTKPRRASGRRDDGIASIVGQRDLRAMPGLTPDQRRRLESGEHPSKIPGLEGGIDLEIDQTGLGRLLHAQPMGTTKDEM